MIDNPGQTGLNFVHCKKLNFHQAETEFSQLVDLAASGDEILIAGSGKPITDWSTMDTRPRS
jgi:antitoxin (DNA-binding transcriptional repressor) of toxin-antitoxin stability system